MFWTDSPLVSSQQPTLQQSGHQMHPRQQLRHRLFASSHDGHLVPVSVRFDTSVALPSVGVDKAARLDGLLNEGMQANAGGMVDLTQANATDTLSVLFTSDYHQSLCLRTAATNPLLQSPYISLVYLYLPAELFAPRSHHRPAHLVQPCPSRRVTA